MVRTWNIKVLAPSDENDQLAEKGKMAELKEAAAEYQVLSKEWSKGAKMDKGKVAAMLEKLKLMLLKLSFIPTKSDEANMKELLLSRDTLEIGAQYAVMQVSSSWTSLHKTGISIQTIVLQEDIPGFERYMAQLQTYYHDHQVCDHWSVT